MDIKSIDKAQKFADDSLSQVRDRLYLATSLRFSIDTNRVFLRGLSEAEMMGLYDISFEAWTTVCIYTLSMKQQALLERRGK